MMSLESFDYSPLQRLYNAAEQRGPLPNPEAHRRSSVNERLQLISGWLDSGRITGDPDVNLPIADDRGVDSDKPVSGSYPLSLCSERLKSPTVWFTEPGKDRA
jgi:hypothetical protein